MATWEQVVAAHGSQSAAARFLGIDRGTLRERLAREKKGLKTPAVPRGTLHRDSSNVTATGRGELEGELASILKRKRTLVTVENLADTLDVAPAKIRTAMQNLRKGGHNITIIGAGVELGRDIPKADPLRINLSKLKGKVFRFGATADNHLGSRYERLDVLNALFDIWASEGISTVYQMGNIIEGDATFNRQDVHTTGMHGQALYLAEHWPHRKGITTQFLTGDDHEGWYVQREGIHIGHYLEDVARKAGRTDLQYIGHMEHDIELAGAKQSTIMRLVHGGGGSSYATSYVAQKLVESYSGGEKPQALLIGHYHKAEYGYHRGVHAVQVGCTQDQSPFMRKKHLAAHLGGWTIEMSLNDDGLITRFKPEFLPFYDKAWTRTHWSYKQPSSKKRAA